MEDRVREAYARGTKVSLLLISGPPVAGHAHPALGLDAPAGPARFGSPAHGRLPLPDRLPSFMTREHRLVPNRDVHEQYVRALAALDLTRRALPRARRRGRRDPAGVMRLW